VQQLILPAAQFLCQYMAPFSNSSRVIEPYRAAVRAHAARQRTSSDGSRCNGADPVRMSLRVQQLQLCTYLGHSAE
jgi:hypothetical protein